MAALPANVGTGTILVKLRRLGLSTDGTQQAETQPVSGRVTFTPSAEMLRHDVDGIVFPIFPVTAYLDANGDATVELVATDDADLVPSSFTYLVQFFLEDGGTINSFHISVPQGTTASLADIAPVPGSNGVYYEHGEVVLSEISAAELAQLQGFYFAYQTTEPPVTMFGVPTVWINPTSNLTTVPVNPGAPVFTDSNSTILIPASVVGVEYSYRTSTNLGTTWTSWISVANGATVTLTGLPKRAQVQALPALGYYIPGVYSWTHDFPDPTAIVLLTSTTFSTGTTLQGHTNDNLLGGSGTYTWSAGGTPPMAINTTNHTVTVGGAATSTSLNTGAMNLKVEWDWIVLPTGGFTIVLNSTNSGWSNTDDFRITQFNGANIRVDGHAVSTAGTLTLNAPASGKIVHCVAQVYEATASLTISSPDDAGYVTYNNTFDLTWRTTLKGTYLLVLEGSAAPNSTVMKNLKISRVGY
jgi:hypothetical protein